MHRKKASTSMESSKLASLCALAKEGHVREAVVAAIDDEQLLFFGELWDTVQLVQVAPDQRPWEQLLHIFCFGTYQDYMTRKAVASQDVPDLSDGALLKLRVLSVLSLAARRRELDYATLRSALGVEEQRQLEDIVMECMHRDMLRGKFDQKNARVAVEYVAGRDASSEDTTHILRILSEWETNVASVISSLDGKRSSLLAAQQAKTEEVRRAEENMEQLQNEAKMTSAGAKGTARSGAAPSGASQKRGRTAQAGGVPME
ncbi:COP9 signalosome complex subunit 7a [Porphyridium purpureum]|uniref:COP9 signalosome complex subunit 7a n=1 Tax=Porphyridium purpureum TaxID=35688 RepID=A0A5J4Z1U1_PORPP|nr:COP9 signalosome complex subunit 7a [Porphyridium purpureum]|eukprot:POR6682..scf208_2